MNSYDLAKAIFHKQRSISSTANDETFEILKEYCCGKLNIKSFDKQRYGTWTTPLKWDFKKAEICDLDNNVLVSSDDNTLHVVAHSQPVKMVLSSKELISKFIYTDPENPARIPYVTSYYDGSWGFCLADEQLSQIKEYEFLKVNIDSKFLDEGVSYAEWFIPGKSEKELLITSYVCHPGMANNELSGMVVVCDLINKFAFRTDLPFGIRFLIWPETFGAIAYLHDRLNQLKKINLGCLVVSCVGDGRALSMVADKNESYITLVTEQILREQSLIYGIPFCKFDFRSRGSDERQFCSPQVNLDCATFCNTKFGMYPEYHSSDDNLDIISQIALDMSVSVLSKIIEFLKYNQYPILQTIGEPKLSEFGIYPHRRNKSSQLDVMKLLNFCAFCDGEHNAVEIANLSNLTTSEFAHLYTILETNDVIK